MVSTTLKSKLLKGFPQTRQVFKSERLSESPSASKQPNSVHPQDLKTPKIWSRTFTLQLPTPLSKLLARVLGQEPAAQLIRSTARHLY